VEREPLPYDHTRGPYSEGLPYACTTGEQPQERVYYGAACPGCRARRAATIARNSGGMVRSTKDGQRRSNLDRFREQVPDYDPIRVLLERHLHARGIS
jgi:hypothetical protein